MSCVLMLQRGHSGDGCVLASTLCKYDFRNGDLFVLSWARRVSRGSLSSELLMCGGGVRSILLLPLVAPKSSVTLLTPDTHQAKIHPRIFIENSHLPLVKCPRILGVYLDPSLSFNKHSQYVAERVSDRNNILKALAGTSWGQQKETLLMTYKAVGRSIINYVAPVWSPNLHDTNYRKIQYTQNEALRIATG